MSSSTSDLEPTQVGATLVSPHKPAGPNRRLPSNARPKSSSGDCLREFLLTTVVLSSLLIATIAIIVCVSILSTQTIAFGYELEELPKLASDFWVDLKRELLPTAWIPRIGREGKAYNQIGKSKGPLNYRKLPTMTEKQLKEFDGSNEHLRILLSIAGIVFDVSSGRNHYKKGGGYNFLAGKDATVSFHTGCFDDECFKTQKVGWEALDQDGRRTIRDWIQSYKDKYVLYGTLQGVFEMYHNNDPSEKHQKYISPLNLAHERDLRQRSSTKQV
jgi:hypothetical protein